MKKIIESLIIITIIITMTGCGCSKEKKEEEKEEKVVEDQIFEGLEFVNVGVSEKEITTVVINNTGVTYEGSKIIMKIMDEEGNIIVEKEEEVKGPVETGTTKKIKTKIKEDISKAAAIEYSIKTK